MSKHKLLLADDSITIQKVVNLTFADEGVEVISVGDGNAAMEKLAEFTPDLVMADINMPGLSGYEICERIRQNEATRHIPVILLVGSFEPFDEEEARRVGASDFLTKPFQSIRQLVTKVSGLLDSAAATEKSSTDEIISDLETPATPAIPGEFEDTLKIHKEESVPEEFGDDGLDDEMIQTNQVGGFDLDEAQKFENQPEVESEVDHSAQTQPLSTAEFSEIDGYQTIGQIVSESERPTEPLAVEEPISTQEERGYAVVGETPFSEPIPAESVMIAEEAIFPKEEAEMPQFSTEPLPQSESFYQTQEVQYAPPIETGSVLDLDDGNLLELPPRENSAAVAVSQPVWQEDVTPIGEKIEPTAETQVEENFATSETTEINQFAPIEAAQEVEMAETQLESNAEVQEAVTDETSAEIEPDESVAEAEIDETPDENQADVEVQEAVAAEIIDTHQIESSEPPEVESWVEEAEPTSAPAQVTSLSPEVIEAIAAKVSERFSDKIIREIVAEITPQITELIAKRISEENSRE